MDLCPCDVNTHSTAVMLKQAGINLENRDVAHLGAHDGIECKIYNYAKARTVNWFECNPFVIDDLKERILTEDNPYKTVHKINTYCLWSESGIRKDFFFYRNNKDGASGLYKDEKMKDHIKDCPMTGESIILETQKIDDLHNYNQLLNTYFLNIDLQGAELEVMKGALRTFFSPISKLEWIWCEVSWDQVYENGPLLKDIDEFLNGHGYNRIGIRKDWAIHGDALYRKVK